jgi:dephospho-CoA kinase
MHSTIRVIGLTGGIATGKSSVARYFVDLAVPVIDADLLARETVLPGTEALKEIVKLFGDKVLTQDGTLDRKYLGSLVFSDKDKRKELEKILHPEIKRLATERIEQFAAAGHKRLIYMAPLIIETGATKHFDEIWVVTVLPEIQIERLMKRDGISRNEAQQIIDSQMPLAEKECHGKVVIDNSGTEEQTRKSLELVWSKEIGSSNE